jgi:hypothetical protein
MTNNNDKKVFGGNLDYLATLREIYGDNTTVIEVWEKEQTRLTKNREMNAPLRDLIDQSKNNT